MIKAKYDWKVADTAISEDFLKIAKKHKLDELTSRVLYQRGIHAEAEIEQFLKPSLENLHDPFLLHDMEKATGRILSAIEQGENILIYGDYDADGMTASSVMKSALDELGAEAQVYLPNRFTDGYGPNLDVYQYYIKNENINLIITVDNGVAGLGRRGEYYQDHFEHLCLCGGTHLPGRSGQEGTHRLHHRPGGV